MNAEHHREQMEAARRDFAHLWENELRTKSLSMGARTGRDLAMAQHVAWHAFLAGLKIAEGE